MKDRQVDLGQLRKALEQEGLTFFPKRKLDIPHISPSDFLNPKFGSKISVLLDFFNLTPIGDNWGTDDRGREAWESQLIKKYGKDLLSEMVASRNSFRANPLGKVMWMSRDIRNMLGEMGLNSAYGEISAIVERMSVHMNGGVDPIDGTQHEDYHQLEDINVKLAIVEFLEDSIIQILDILKREIEVINSMSR